MSFYVYILHCSDDTLYTGWTSDIVKRINTHNSGKGAKYTRSRLPVKLVHFEEFETKELAMSRECEIKKLSRDKKLDLISNI
ncbi:MAG: GIY-YIG nuclease family protein [Synergistaceae bacterium]